MSAARRSVPRYTLRLPPTLILKRWRDMSAYCLEASQDSETPFDFVIEFHPGTTGPTGRILFEHPEQTNQVKQFILTLEKETL